MRMSLQKSLMLRVTDLEERLLHVAGEALDVLVVLRAELQQLRDLRRVLDRHAELPDVTGELLHPVIVALPRRDGELTQLLCDPLSLEHTDGTADRDGEILTGDE